MLDPRIDFAELRARTLVPDEARAEAIRAGVVDRQARYATRVRFARGALVLASVAAVVAFVVRRQALPPLATPTVGAATAAAGASAVMAAGGSYGGLVLPDGSRVTFLAAGTELAQSGRGRQSTLVRGAARFDVVHDPETRFRVTAGSVVIEDVGTVFTVGLEEDGRTSVAVESGSVSVRDAEGERNLGAGEAQTFPLPPPVAPPASVPSSPAQVPSWKKLAAAGDYDRAYALIQTPGTSVGDNPEELLLAADSARLSGHAERAVPLLRRMIARYPTDSRAGLAAFTLGRVLLDDLGRPREAAAAFAAAYERGGPLAEDALAREVQSWAGAGDATARKDAARRYLAAYPAGRHAAIVGRLAEER
jgi:transmembrane sensor